MKYLRFFALLSIIGGILMIALSRQLAILYEGPQYSMSDLGFVVGGMMLTGLGIFLLLLMLILHFKKKLDAMTGASPPPSPPLRDLLQGRST